MIHGLVGVKYSRRVPVLQVRTCLLNEIESYEAFTFALPVQVEVGGTIEYSARSERRRLDRCRLVATTRYSTNRTSGGVV